MPAIIIERAWCCHREPNPYVSLKPRISNLEHVDLIFERRVRFLNAEVRHIDMCGKGNGRLRSVLDLSPQKLCQMTPHETNKISELI